MKTSRLRPDDDLACWAAAISRASWDEDNAIDAPYTETSLTRYLAQPHSVLVVAEEAGELLGMASGSLLLKPYGDERWLYVDEVDVAVPHRRRGVGRALMKALFVIAEAEDCEELWLGTERDNAPAIALYRSLSGAEDAVLGYTFEVP